MRGAVKKMGQQARDLLAASLEPRSPDIGAQLVLSMSYREKTQERLACTLSEYGFSCYSQTDEDGILLYIFSVVGATNRSCVEICAGDGIQCNTANLIVNHGWSGLLIDGERENVERGTRFYAKSPRTCIYPPMFLHAWITRGTVNDLLVNSGFSGEIDLLSLDLDGVDYWIWEAMTVVKPRVVVVEYQDILGPERSWTVPYADDFVAGRHSMTNAMPNFAGASLRAFVNLARHKGYRLIGVNQYGFNAFFARDDIGVEILPEISVAECFTHPKVIDGMRERFPLVADMPWVQV
jgi:hypothetical protein